jgi:hypothetical protein
MGGNFANKQKDWGFFFISVGKIIDSTTDTTTAGNSNDSLLIMTSPLLGFHKSLGTLIVTYCLE